MIGLEDRQRIAQDIGTAHADGARLYKACAVAGIDVRTLQRWQAGKGLVAGDLRPVAARSAPAHAFSAAERAQVLQVVSSGCKLIHGGCGPFLGLVYVVNPKLSRYSIGLR